MTQKPPVSLTQIADVARVDRTSLSKVEHGDRSGLEREALGRVLDKFPGIAEFASEIVTWEWTPATRAHAQRVLR